MDGLDGYGWDLCVGLLYEHRFAMLIISETIFTNKRNYIHLSVKN